MQRAYVALGANLGDARATLEAACDALSRLPGTQFIDRSAWYRSAPVQAHGPDFVNGVVVLDTTLAPLALLDALQVIEQQHGRERPYRHAPRTLDLDLLLYGGQCMHSERLTLPHPRMHERAFVLLPLIDIAPGLVIPGLGPAKDCLAAVSGQAIQRLAG